MRAALDIVSRIIHEDEVNIGLCRDGFRFGLLAVGCNLWSVVYERLVETPQSGMVGGESELVTVAEDGFHSELVNSLGSCLFERSSNRSLPVGSTYEGRPWAALRRWHSDGDNLTFEF